MEEGRLQDLETLFAQVEDPRVERTKLHRLRDIIILAISGGSAHHDRPLPPVQPGLAPRRPRPRGESGASSPDRAVDGGHSARHHDPDSRCVSSGN